MKKRKRTIVWMLLFSVLISLISSLKEVESFKAASSYLNAKEFYESTIRTDRSYHAEAYNGKVYYATQGKLASSSSNTKYLSVGWDVTLSGNGHSVSFTIQKNDGSLVEVHQCQANNYQYNLYCITEDRLYELASKADSYNASYVLGASRIDVRMDAIMTTKKGNTVHGGITENGYGGFTKWGTIYRLKNPADLQKMREIFSGHLFESFTDVNVYLENYLLKVRYNVLGLNPTNTNPMISNSSYSFDASGYLNKAGVAYMDESRTLKKITLLNTSSIGLSKTGYYLPSGKEWITNDFRDFASNGTYQSTTVDPTVGYKDHGITLYANWKPHKYTIVYNANGGSGSMVSTTLYYDNMGTLNKNLFTRAGYKFSGWNTRADGKGTSYTDQKQVSNLMTTSGTITLYAQWEPCVYQITTDKQTGMGGTDTFWQKYGTGFFSNALATDAYKIGSITLPEKTGYDFQGYFSWILGSGNKIVNNKGSFSAGNTYFTEDATIYADWKPKTFIVNFNQQGGSQGSIFATATYDTVYPTEKITAPVRPGYRFLGYYTEENGAGEMIYNEFMAADKIYKELTDQTLYAYWMDDVPPEVTLSSNDSWTNQKMGLEATCSDFGSGLKSVEIYLVDADGNETLMVESTDLNGAKTHTLSYENITEGVIRYKAVATDMEDNTAESYNTALFDITAPTGEVITVQINGNTFYFEVDITDINTGD